jgi:hypothetical protein
MKYLSAAIALIGAGTALAGNVSSAFADQYGYHCPPTAGDRMTIQVNDTCVHGRNHALTEIYVYRDDNTTTRHCAGANATTSPSSSHVVGYVCAIGNPGNGYVTTPYYSAGVMGYPIHKNDGPYIGGFWSWFNYISV